MGIAHSRVALTEQVEAPVWEICNKIPGINLNRSNTQRPTTCRLHICESCKFLGPSFKNRSLFFMRMTGPKLKQPVRLYLQSEITGRQTCQLLLHSSRENGPFCACKLHRERNARYNRSKLAIHREIWTRLLFFFTR